MIYRYEYERAVREGFLVDYDVVTVKSDVRMNGVFLNEGEQVGMVDTTTGSEQMDLLEDERQFNTAEVEENTRALAERIDKLEFQSMLSGELDGNNCFLSIHAGAGGTESCDWAAMLIRMYMRWCEARGYTVEEIECFVTELKQIL